VFTRGRYKINPLNESHFIKLSTLQDAVKVEGDSVVGTDKLHGFVLCVLNTTKESNT
jgi:hypothetical protein